VESSKFTTLGATDYLTGYLVSSSIIRSVRCRAGPRIVSATPQEPSKLKQLYLKNNIHTQTNDSKTYRVNYENWTNPVAGHIIFPVNTIVEIEYGRIGFYIIEKITGKKIDKADPYMAQYNPNDTRGYIDVPDTS
jgi:hypothetical protein